MSNGIVVFGGGNVVSKFNKSDRETVRVMTKKEYRAEHKLTSAEANRLHPQYLLEVGIAANGNLSAMLATGQVVAQRKVNTATGFNVTFVRTSEKRFEEPSGTKAAAALAEKVAIEAKLHAALDELAALKASMPA